MVFSKLKTNTISLRAHQILVSTQNNTSLYTDGDRSLLQTAINIEPRTPADILERILFVKHLEKDGNDLRRIELIDKILSNNPDISINDTLFFDFISTPLMACTANGCSRICVSLLQSSVQPDPFIKDNKEKHLLHLLVSKGHQRDDDQLFIGFEDQRPLFEMVLNHKNIKLHINDQDSNGQTALHYAAARRDFYYIERLISKGADPELRDQFGRNFWDVIQLAEQERVNIIGPALKSPGDWDSSLQFTIFHPDNPKMRVGNEQGRDIGYYCGHINKALFNQDVNQLAESTRSLIEKIKPKIPSQKSTPTDVDLAVDTTIAKVKRGPITSLKDDLGYEYATLRTGRFHIFTATPKGLIPRFKRDKGDVLKTRILLQFKAKLAKATSPIELQRIVQALKSSPEYTILKTGQGITTRLFGIKTDSVKACEKMVKKAAQDLGIGEQRNNQPT